MTERTDGGAERRRSRGRTAWLVGAAVLVVLVAPAIAYLFANHGVDGTRDNPSSRSVAEKSSRAPAKTTLTLESPPTAAQQSCPVFSVGILRGMPVAFSGTVVDAASGVVTFKVDRWYHGGTADQVRLIAPDPKATVALRGGAVSFSSGGRYLISATSGVANDCDLSGPWSTNLEKSFKQAFNG